MSASDSSSPLSYTSSPSPSLLGSSSRSSSAIPKRRASEAFSSPPGSPLISPKRARSLSTASSTISSDTSGSVHISPTYYNEDDEQVTVCRWDACNKDMGNMDELVKHIHDFHIGSRKSLYSCQWDDCLRKNLPRASGYAFRAHMRSHTKEKPIYCSLPECDRCFTRSDALAKHMRTIHETEALHSSDPIPKTHTAYSNHPLGKGDGTKEDGFNAMLGSMWDDGDVQYSSDEEKLDWEERYRYLKMKLREAKVQSAELDDTCSKLQEKRRQAWIKKEMLLETVLKEQLGEDYALISAEGL